MALTSLLKLGLFITTTCIGDAIASAAEKTLRTYLFDHYNKLALPVRNSSDTLTIHFNLFVEQIVDLDERNQVFTSKVWVKQVWHDHSLEWDPALFGNIRNIKVPSESIWIPDIVIYNNANGTFDMRAIPWAGVNHTGHVTWFPPAIYKTACKIDVRFFPFDEQTCILRFGSWSYDEEKLDLIPSNTSAKRDFRRNGEWSITESLCIRNVTSHNCCNDTYVDVTCTFVLRRMALYYFAYILLPCGLISFNTILVFYLPPDISEKMSLCTMVLLSMAWFLLLVNQRIPPNATNFPLIVKYLLFTMIIVSSSIMITVYILNLCHRSPRTHKQMPKWVRKLFLDILPKFVSIQRPQRYANRHRHVGIMLTSDAVSNNRLDGRKLAVESNGNNLIVRMRSELDENEDDGDSQLSVSLDDEREQILQEHPVDNDPRRDLSDTVVQSEALVIHKAIEEIMHLASLHTSKEDLVLEREDWKYLAMVVDRLFLILYLCAIFAGTTVILSEAPLAKSFFKNWLFPSEDMDLSDSFASPNMLYVKSTETSQL